MNSPSDCGLPDKQALRAQLTERSAHLQIVADQLKQELVGIGGAGVPLCAARRFQSSNRRRARDKGSRCTPY